MTTTERATLHEIADELRDVELEIAEAGGEITPEIEARIAAWEGALEDKAERILRYYHESKTMAKAAKAEADRLKDVAKTYANRADSLKGLLDFELRRMDRRDVETPVGKAWLQRNPPTAKILRDPEDLPERFVRVVPETRKVDKRAILEAAAEGEDVSEWAQVVQTDSLRIR